MHSTLLVQFLLWQAAKPSGDNCTPCTAHHKAKQYEQTKTHTTSQMAGTCAQLLPADVLRLGHPAQPPPAYQRHQRVAHAAAPALRVQPVERRTAARHAARRLTHINIWRVGHLPYRFDRCAHSRLQRRTAHGCRLPSDTQRGERGQFGKTTLRRVAVGALPFRNARQVAHRSAALSRLRRTAYRHRCPRRHARSAEPFACLHRRVALHAVSPHRPACAARL